jgi:hypothetical protein
MCAGRACCTSPCVCACGRCALGVTCHGCVRAELAREVNSRVVLTRSGGADTFSAMNKHTYTGQAMPAHCSSCGNEAPTTNPDGTSSCCAKRVCGSDSTRLYVAGRRAGDGSTTDTGTVKACCLAMAAVRAGRLGGGVVALRPLGHGDTLTAFAEPVASRRTPAPDRARTVHGEPAEQGSGQHGACVECGFTFRHAQARATCQSPAACARRKAERTLAIAA